MIPICKSNDTRETARAVFGVIEGSRDVCLVQLVHGLTQTQTGSEQDHRGCNENHYYEAILLETKLGTNMELKSFTNDYSH